MVEFKAQDVPCPVCRAVAGQRCVYVRHPDPAFRGATMRAGHHNDRCAAAQLAEKTANQLLQV